MGRLLSADAGAAGALREPLAQDPLVLEAALGGDPSGLGDLLDADAQRDLLQAAAGANGFHERRVELDIVPREPLPVGRGVLWRVRVDDVGVFDRDASSRSRTP